MSSVSFSGLATGLDTGSIISQLVELKRAPVYRLQKDKQSYQNQISSLATLKTKLLALQTAARKLDTSTEFSTAKATSSDTDALTVSAGGSASPGQYNVKVLSLATSQKLQSQGYDSKLDNIGSGRVSITIDGKTKELNLTGVNTLQGLASAINDNVEGVSAAIVNSGAATGGYTLVVNGAEAGTANAFTLDLSGLTGGVPPVMTTKSTAADASLSIDDILITADSNTPDDAISGITLRLLQADVGKTVTVTVARDTDGISDKVKGLTDAYNDLFSFIAKESAADGTLRENAALRTVASSVENMFGSSFATGLGDITMFAQMGVKRGSNRQVEFDAAKLKDALAAQFGSVRDFFVKREGNVGKASQLDTLITSLTSSTQGVFKASTTSLNKRIDNVDDSIARYERSIESYQSTLQRRFTAMEQMVSQLQAQGNYLGSIR
jgi:flagellar hook-associated protein 2